MSKELLKFIKNQLDWFYTHLELQWCIPKSALQKLHPKLRPIYIRYLGLACLLTAAGKKRQRNEFSSAGVEILRNSIILQVRNLPNSSAVLNRQVIELTLKHIYFSTHPTEYEWTCEDLAYKEITFQFLLEYIRKLKGTKIIDKLGGEATKTIGEWYSILSRYVHVHNSSFFSSSTKSSQTFANIDSLSLLDRCSKELWPYLILISIATNPSLYTKMPLLEQRIIRYYISKKHRNILDELLHAQS